MRITIVKSFYIAGTMFLLLIAGIITISFFKIDRKVRINGSFVYRQIAPVVCAEEGMVERIPAKENQLISQGDTILILTNPDIIMGLNNSINRLNILDLELKKILDVKEQDFNLSNFDQNKLRQDFAQNSRELLFYQKELDEKKNLLSRNLISGKEVDELNLKVRSLSAETEKLKLAIAEIDSKIKGLNSSSLLLYSLKLKEIEMEKENNRFLTKCKNNLVVTAKTTGRILADSRLDNYLYRHVKKGDQLADVVSSDDINFVGYARDADIIRIKPNQKAYFNVELFRGKNSITGKVRSIGYKPKLIDNISYFPIEIEVDKKEFFDRDKKLFLEAGVQGEGIILTEENLPIFKLIWEKFVSKLDFLG